MTTFWPPNRWCRFMSQPQLCCTVTRMFFARNVIERCFTAAFHSCPTICLSSIFWFRARNFTRNIRRMICTVTSKRSSSESKNRWFNFMQKFSCKFKISDKRFATKKIKCSSRDGRWSSEGEIHNRLRRPSSTDSSRKHFCSTASRSSLRRHFPSLSAFSLITTRTVRHFGSRGSDEVYSTSRHTTSTASWWNKCETTCRS